MEDADEKYSIRIRLTEDEYKIKKLCDGFGITITEFFDTDYFRSLDQEIF